MSKIAELVLVRFGLILWHDNECWLLNAQSSLYTCIKYIWFVNTFFRQLNGSKDYYVSPSIQLDINHLFTRDFNF